MKKVLSLTLVLLMLLAALVGCKKDKQETTNTSDTSDVSESESETDDYGQVVVKSDIDVDELGFDGATVSILTRGSHQYMREFGLDGVIEQSDVVDEKIYARNSRIEQDLNVTLMVSNGESLWSSTGYTAFITNQTAAGAPAVDVISAAMPDTNDLGVSANFANLLSSEMKYLNTSKAYWNQSYIEAAGANGCLLTVVGDLSLSVYDRMMVQFINYGLLSATSQTKESLQQMILDGKWTLEEMKKLVREFGWVDKDGSNTKTDADEFGYVGWAHSEMYDPFTAAFNIPIIGKNDSGEFVSMYEANATKFNNAFSQIDEFRNETSVYKYSTYGPATDHFTEGRTLILQDVMRRNEGAFTKMLNSNVSFGIIPIPKYDATAQDNYQTFSQDQFNVIAVMDCISDERKEQTSAVLELMAAYSYSDVRPYYVEDTLKIKYSEDSTSVRIMNLLMDGMTFDTAWVHLGNTGFMAEDIFRGCFYTSRTGTTPANAWASGRVKYLTEIATLNQWFATKAAQDQ